MNEDLYYTFLSVFLLIRLWYVTKYQTTRHNPTKLNLTKYLKLKVVNVTRGIAVETEVRLPRLSTHFPRGLPFTQVIFISIFLSFSLDVSVSIYINICLSIYDCPSNYVYWSICLLIYLSIYPSVNMPLFLTVCLYILHCPVVRSIFLSTYLSF